MCACDCLSFFRCFETREKKSHGTIFEFRTFGLNLWFATLVAFQADRYFMGNSEYYGRTGNGCWRVSIHIRHELSIKLLAYALSVGNIHTLSLSHFRVFSFSALYPPPLFVASFLPRSFAPMNELPSFQEITSFSTFSICTIENVLIPLIPFNTSWMLQLCQFWINEAYSRIIGAEYIKSPTIDPIQQQHINVKSAGSYSVNCS